MQVKVLGRKKTPIKITLKSPVVLIKTYDEALLKIYNQSKEDYKHGKIRN